MTCQCRFCQRADHYFDRETDHMRASHVAQRFNDFETAKREDKCRVRLLDSALRAIENCEGEEGVSHG